MRRLNQHRYVSLSQGELNQIGTYFKRHYKQGERVPITDNFTKDPLGWLRQQPMFDIHKFPLDMEGYKPERDKPRILLREKKGFLTHWIRYQQMQENSPVDMSSINSTEFSDYRFSEGHFEWKTWLQYRVEQISIGQGSIKLLASQLGNRNSEREKATKKLQDLSNLFLDVFEENIINEDHKTALHIGILEKFLNYRQSKPDRGVFQTTSEGNRPIIWSKISTALVNSLVSLSKFKSLPNQNKDDFEISIAANSFLSDFSKEVSNILLTEIEEAEKISSELGDNLKHWVGLDKKELKQFEDMLQKGFSFSNSRQIKSPEKVTQTQSLGLSYHIMIFLIWEGYLETKSMNWADYVTHYSNPNKSEDLQKSDGKKSYPHMLVFTDELKKRIGNCTLSDFKTDTLHPIFRWLNRRPDRYMYCPPMDPKQKDGKWIGGFCQPRGSIISSHFDYEEFETPRCKPSEDAIKSIKFLQTTQWEINLDFLEIICDFFPVNDSKPIENIRIKENWIDRIVPKKQLNKAFFHVLNENSENEMVEKNEQRKTNLSHVKRIIEHNANVFWHAWNFDFRGRMYPQSRHLSPQGDDLDKALIRFKEWKNLGNRGIFWLHVHVHNLFEGVNNDGWKNGPAKKRQTFEIRNNWVEENLNELRRIASDPIAKRNIEILELDTYRGGGSESFQRLAALLELDRVHSEYEEKNDWNEVKSGLPIHLDASTNGYQHLSALLRDEKLAREVNIEKVNSPNDLYKKVSDKAEKIFLEGDFSQITNSKTRSEYETILNSFSDEERDFLEAVLFTRKFAKQPTMRLAYGGSRLENCYDGKNSTGNPRWVKFRKSEEQLEMEEDARSKIPEKLKQEYEKYEDLKTWYRKKGWKWSWFQNRVGNETAARKYQSLLREWEWVRCWHNESLLYEAFRNSVDNIPDTLVGWDVKDRKNHNFNDNEYDMVIFQNKVTKLVDKIYTLAVEDVTNKANSTLTLQLRKLFQPKKDDEIYKHVNVINWKLPDDFRVKNYYIKHRDEGKHTSNKPTKHASLYSVVKPTWAGLTSKNKNNFSASDYLSRFKEIIGDEEFHKIIKDDDLAKKGIKPMLEEILEGEDLPRSEDDKGGSTIGADLDEIRKFLKVKNHNINQYHEDELKRLNPSKVKSSVAPNFIHSLDAYHMRESIRRMGSDDNKLDFWAVHDSFGTHASDVDKLREVVISSFHEFYLNREINSIGAEISENWSEIKLMDFNSDEIKHSQYMIS